MATFKLKERYVRNGCITPDGKLALIGAEALTLWDLTTGQKRVLDERYHDVTAISITSDGRRAVSANYDRTIRVWDVQRGLYVPDVEMVDSGIRSIAVTPNGKSALFGCVAGWLRLWDLEGAKLLRTLRGHRHSGESEINSVSITPDGRTAISACHDTTLRLWDLEQGRCIRVLKPFNGDDIQSVKITPDGRRAISVGNDRKVRIWDLVHGRCISALAGCVFVIIENMPSRKHSLMQDTGYPDTLRLAPVGAIPLASPSAIAPRMPASFASYSSSSRSSMRGG
ncbi:MAG: hypothetical protein WA324_15230 [Bryobacteraceae bacterium]